MLSSKVHRINCLMAVCLTVAAFCGGCSRAPDPNRYVPASELARAALEAVLVDWKEGLPCDMVKRLSVQVYPIDNQRKKGQQLAGFEILGEVPLPGVRCFAVRLRYQNTAQDAKVRYVVLGIDPLFVYREEDFDLLNRWDHMMPGEPAEESPAPMPDPPAQPEPSDD